MIGSFVLTFILASSKFWEGLTGNYTRSVIKTSANEGTLNFRFTGEFKKRVTTLLFATLIIDLEVCRAPLFSIFFVTSS